MSTDGSTGSRVSQSEPDLSRLLRNTGRHLPFPSVGISDLSDPHRPFLLWSRLVQGIECLIPSMILPPCGRKSHAPCAGVPFLTSLTLAYDDGGATHSRWPRTIIFFRSNPIGNQTHSSPSPSFLPIACAKLSWRYYWMRWGLYSPVAWERTTGIPFFLFYVEPASARAVVCKELIIITRLGSCCHQPQIGKGPANRSFAILG